jgi:hypothetical protein
VERPAVPFQPACVASLADQRIERPWSFHIFSGSHRFSRACSPCSVRRARLQPCRICPTRGTALAAEVPFSEPTQTRLHGQGRRSDEGFVPWLSPVSVLCLGPCLCGAKRLLLPLKRAREPRRQESAVYSSGIQLQIGVPLPLCQPDQSASDVGYCPWGYDFPFPEGAQGSTQL